MDLIPRLNGFPNGLQAQFLFRNDQALKAHAAYAAAKAGNADAALTLVLDLAVSWLYAQRSSFATGCIFVAPHAQEAAGDNAIPQTLAGVCAAIYGGVADTDIVQSDRVYHTGADPIERMATRAQFVGQVHPRGKYVLVDDVLTLGGTLAELSNWIVQGDGEVVGVVLLVHAGRELALCPTLKFVRLLHERHGHEFFKTFGIQPAALSANEANYLVGFRSTNEIRNRLATAQQEIHLRLRAKGIAHAFERPQL